MHLTQSPFGTYYSISLQLTATGKFIKKKEISAVCISGMTIWEEGQT
jgi:hypothetical protein